MSLCKHCGFRPAESNANRHCRVCHSYFSGGRMQSRASKPQQPASNPVAPTTNYTAPATPAVKTQRSDANNNAALNANNRFQNVRSKPLSGGTSSKPLTIVRCMGYKCDPSRDANKNANYNLGNYLTTNTLSPVNGETNVKTQTSTSTKTSKSIRQSIYAAVKDIPAFKTSSIADQKTMLDIAVEMHAEGTSIDDIVKDIADDGTDATPAVDATDKQQVDVADVLADCGVKMAAIKGMLATVGYTVANPAFVLLPAITATAANVERQAAPDVNKGAKGKSGQKTTTRKAKIAEKDTPVADATASNKPAATPPATPATPVAPVAAEKPTEPKPSNPASGKATQKTRNRAKELGIKPYWLPNQTEASLLAKIKEAEAKQTPKPVKTPKATASKQEEKVSKPGKSSKTAVKTTPPVYTQDDVVGGGYRISTEDEIVAYLIARLGKEGAIAAIKNAK